MIISSREVDLSKLTAPSIPSSPRLLIVDPCIEGQKGHFLELATVIAQAAMANGYQPTLLTSQQFRATDSVANGIAFRPTFSCSKIRRWSLGPHGYSRLRRDLKGRPIGGSLISRGRQWLVDRLHGQLPTAVLQSSAAELTEALEDLQPTDGDQILINTCDDFMLLMVAAAMKDFSVNCRLNLIFLWHNPVAVGRACEPAGEQSRQSQTKLQLDDCLVQLQQHQCRFLATTEELRKQYSDLIRQDLWHKIDYPIRSNFAPQPVANIASAQTSVLEMASASEKPIVQSPLRVVCGGALRSEKGEGSLTQCVKLLWEDYLKSQRLRLCLQVPHQQLKKLLPADYRQDASAQALLEIAEPSMNASAYTNWIGSAEIGLFLYNSRRYYTRCSGVLIEMLACGVPVIVPAGSWLSRQIAAQQSQHLDSIALNLGSCYQLPIPLTDLPSAPRTSHRTVHRELKGNELFTFRVNGGDETAYLGIEMLWQDRQGCSLSRWHLLELIEGVARLLITPMQAQQSQGMIEMRFWQPFRQQGLSLSRVELQHSTSDAPCYAPVALGATFARLEDLVYCFDELIEYYPTIRQQTIQHAELWRRKHSGAAFFSSAFEPEGKQWDYNVAASDPRAVA